MPSKVQVLNLGNHHNIQKENASKKDQHQENYANKVGGIFRTLSNTEDGAFCKAKIVNGWKPLTVFAKHFILGVWQGSEYTSGSWQSDPGKS